MLLDITHTNTDWGSGKVASGKIASISSSCK
jgi:hypothetical protein